MLGDIIPNETPDSFGNASERLVWRKTLLCYLRLHLTFALCARTDWTAAQQSMNELQKSVELVGTEIPESLQSLILYLVGVIHQGTGDLDAAITVYMNPTFNLDNYNGPAISGVQSICRDVAILASLNSVFIWRDVNRPQYHKIDPMLEKVAPLCESHPNLDLQAAFNLVKAVGNPNDPIIKTKTFLQLAMKGAQSVANNQLLSITLSFMSWKYFRGVVGEQAEKSARA